MQEVVSHDSYYDFNDGNGVVPAHRHVNGGGWVADTAAVDDTAYVGLGARVFGNASVSGYAVVDEHAEVSGYATIKDRARIKGRAVIRGLCIIKDDAEVSGKAFLAGTLEIGGHCVLDHNENFFNYEGCLECPALLDENYSAGHFNPCMYCLEKQKGQMRKNEKAR